MTIFCIGMPKTGTKSFCSALQTLGYATCHHGNKFNRSISKYLSTGVMSDILKKKLEEKDAFADGSFIYRFKELYEKFPEAKFVLTTRNVEGWLVSFVNHSYVGGNPSRRPLLTSDRWRWWLKKFNNHNREAKEFFTDKDNFLELDFCDKKDRWKPICDFLCKDTPSRGFPRRGRTKRVPGRNFLNLEEVMEFFNLTEDDLYAY